MMLPLFLRRAVACAAQPVTIDALHKRVGHAGMGGLLLAFAFALSLLSAAMPASAQTPVSGAIAVDTRWTAEGAPYIVSGDVVVQNGAALTIDAGVTVYMAADASLSVHAGAIKASGTAAQPIRVLSDNARLGRAAAPGDWKQWTFNRGTVDTQLDHVVFSHGSGLAVNGSAPVFNFIEIRDHQGAAMTVDLAASPSGAGNRANGNTLNGIAVPAGDITGSVKWALRGIPYVVTSGVVSVGESPTVESITPNVVQAGQTVTMVLTGTRLAGLERARVANPGVTAHVLAGGTATRASISVVADASSTAGPAALRLLTDAGEIQVDNAITLARAQPTLSSLTPTPIYVGQGTVDVAINGRDFVAQSTVLVNDAPVTTAFVSSTELRASVATPAAATNLGVKVRSPDPLKEGEFLTSNALGLPVVVGQLVVAPASATVTKGTVRVFSVTLPFKAPAGGATLNVVSSVPSVASIPSTVPVPEGQDSVSFQLTAADIGDTTVTVSQVGLRSAQAMVTVVPPPTLTLTPTTLLLGVGRTGELAVTSSVPAPAGGMTVMLNNSAPAAVVVPASVSIAAGARSATLNVSTLEIGNATIRAEAAEFVAGIATVNVRPVSLNMPAGVLVAPGLARSVPIILSDPAPAGGLEVTLISSNPAVATVPASVLVPAGASSVNFTLSGVAVGTASVSATASNYREAALPVTVDAVQIRFGNPTVTSISLPEEATRQVALTLSRPAPAGGVVIDLASSDPAKATVSPASITIAEGQTSGGAVLLSVTGVAKGSATLNASAPGLTSASIPLTVTGKPQLLFNRSSVYVGKGLTTYSSELSISRRTDSASYAPDEPVTVTLTSSDPSKAALRSGTVTIPAGSSSVTFSVNGLELTDTGTVTIDASAPEYNAPATKLTTRVVAPVFALTSLDLARTPESVRDEFYVSVTTPNSTYSGSQTATADTPIELSIVDAAPDGIVDGFYSVATGGTPVTQVMLKRGYANTEAGSGYSYIGTPTAAGSYKVRASAPGLASVTSAQVNVTGPGLKFSRTAVPVAKGFRTYVSEVSVQRIVNGTAFSGQNALTVNLTSSDPSRASVPASVTIPANASSVSFYVTGVELTSGTPVTIDAAAEGHAAPTAKLAATVILPTITFTSLDTTRSPASERDSFYLSATTPGSTYSGSQTAAADFTVDLSIVDATPADIVSGFSTAATAGSAVTQLVWTRGSTYTNTSNTFVNTPTAAGSYKVRAALQNITTVDSPVVAVTAPDLQLRGVSSATITSVAKGFITYSSELRVNRLAGGSTIATNAPVTVALTSSDPGKVRAPATVTIPAGSSSASFRVTGVELTGSTPVTLTATADGHNGTTVANSLRINVVAPVFAIGSLDLNRTPASARDDFTVSASTPGAYYSGNQTAAADIPIDLSIVEQNPAGIVEGVYGAATGGAAITQVVLPSGSNSTARAYIAMPSAAGSYKLLASAAGLNSVTSGVVTVSPPQLTFSRTTVTVGKGLETYIEELRVNRSINNTAFNGTAAVTVNLRCTSAVICSVPESVVIPAGQAYVRFKVRGNEIGGTTIVASAEGYDAVRDLPVNVVAPELRLSVSSTTKVGAQSNVSTSVYVPDVTYPGNQTAVSPITVSLTSSSPWVATVPETLTIAAGATSSATGKLTGVAAGSTTVTASGTGLVSVTSGTVTISP